MSEITSFKAGDELTSSRLNEMVDQINSNADTKAIADANAEAIQANSAADAETAANVQKNADAIAKLDSAITAIQTVVNANAALSNEVTALSKVVNARKATTQVIAATNEAADVGESDKDIVVTSTDALTSKVSVYGKNVSIQDLAVTSSTLKVTSTGIVDVTGLNTSGTVDKATLGNAGVSINTTGDTIRISGCDFSATGYNTLELQLNSTSTNVKNVVIDNCRFGDTSNNSILLFRNAVDANVTIKKCTFGKVSNPVRLSNAENTNITLTMIDCSIESVESGDYCGIICLQDYTSADATSAQSNNLFAPEKVTINFINVTLAGEKVVAKEPENQLGSKTPNQLMYVYTNKEGFISYNKDRYPTVTFG